MPLMINTNVASLNAQRQLLHSGGDLDQASERLSSGKRVNTAADDAAGLAIANRMTSQIRGLDQAIRNANDGISMIQTAEGALDESTNILQRMRELAIQASNGIYSDADRSSLDAEVQQLKEELDRIAETTTFNGQNILDGSLGRVDLQVGSEAYETVSLDIQGFNTSSLGGASGDIVGSTTSGIAALQALTADGDLTINDISISANTASANLNAALNSINAELDGKGAEVGALVNVEATGSGSGVLIPGTSQLDITVTDGDGLSNSYQITGTNSMDELVDKINADTSITASLNEDGLLVLAQEGVTSIQTGGTGIANTGLPTATTQFSLSFTDTSAEGNGVKVEVNTANVSAADLANLGINVNDDNGNLIGNVPTTFTAITEGQIVINGVDIPAITANTGAAEQVDDLVAAFNRVSDQTGVVAFEANTLGTQIGLRSTSGDYSIEVAKGLTAANLTAFTGFIERNAAEGAGSVASISIDTVAGAQRSLDIIDTALEEINSVRADMGAVNNRLDFTISNLANISENTSASRSRIMDADFAKESANLSRAQVLQQASQAMLAQANARPQEVLQLLQ